MTEYLDYFYEEILEILPVIALGIIALLVFVVIVIPILIRLEKRIELSIKNHRWMPRWLYKEQEALLSLTPVVELFAPYDQHTRDVQRGEKRPRKLARFTPYQRAARTAYRVHRQPRNGFFDAPAQVATAGKAIQLRQLTELETKIIPDYNERKHYAIIFNYSGLEAKDIEKLYPKIKSQLKLEALTELERTSSIIRLRADKKEVDDILTAHKNTADFLLKHPAKSWTSIPIATTSKGETYSLPTHHTLISGLTGAGKGSVLRSLVYQFQQLKQDTGIPIQMFGIDPKRADLFLLSPLLDDFTDDTDHAAQIIDAAHKQMNKHKKIKNGADFKPSDTTPLTILFIDELVSLLLEPQFKQNGKPFKQLSQLLFQGRSEGVFVIGATQRNDQNLFNGMRGNFSNVITLRQESEHFAKLFIGDQALTNDEFNPLLIPVSNSENKYRYSGIAICKQDDGAPVRVRVAYPTNDEIAELTEPYRRAQPVALKNLLNDDTDLYSLI